MGGGLQKKYARQLLTQLREANVFKFPLFKTYYAEEFDKIMSEVLRSGAVASGSYIAQFEADIAKMLEQKYALTTSDMSSAIYLALYLAGVKAGDEVATTSFTCMSSSSPIHAIGAKPLWIDLAPGSLHMDPSKLCESISEKTKAVILYHTAGYPAECKTIADICKERNIPLIEDCNNTILATTSTGLCGALADFSIYSFYPNRLVNAIEGGLLVCKDEEHYSRAKKLRRFGVDQQTFRNSFGEINPSSDIPEIGWAMNMPNFNCALAWCQIKDVHHKLANIRRNANIIDKCLAGNKMVDTFKLKAGERPSYWAYMLKVPKRDLFIQELKKVGIHASSLHQRNDIYSGFGSTKANLPETESLQKSILALPVGWWLQEDDITEMMDIFAKVQMQIEKED